MLTGHLEVFTVLGMGSVCVDWPFGSFHCPGDGVSVLTGHLEVFTVLGMGSVCVFILPVLAGHLVWRFVQQSEQYKGR